MFMRSVKQYTKAQDKMAQMQEDLLPHERWALHAYGESLVVVNRLFQTPKRSAKYLWRSAWVLLSSAENLLDKRLGDMATKKHSNSEFKFDQWVNIRLEENHKEELAHLCENIDFSSLSGWLSSMAYEGYSFSCSWDDYSDALQVSLVCKAPDDPNYGLGLSARHPDFDLAVLTLQFKHEQIADGNWAKLPPTPKGNSWG